MPSTRRGVLFVTKPLTPPWHDSGKNLARDLAVALSDWEVHVMSQAGGPPLAPHVVMEPIYKQAGTYSAGIWQNLAPLLRLLAFDRIPLYHFFFAPNRNSSMAAKAILSVKRRHSVHTISSAPASFEGIRSLLFADRIVALSQHTRRRLEQAGVQRVDVIPPCVPLSAPVSEERKRSIREALKLPEGAQIVLFAGDYEFSSAARTCTNALAPILAHPNAHFVFACRVKRPPSIEAEAAIRGEVTALPQCHRVHFLNEVADMEALVAAASVQVMPVDSLYAKMDIPLVLLESLREGVPVVVGDYGPLKELLEEPVGLAVPPASPAALAEAVSRLLGDEALRRELGENGRSRVATYYSPEVMAKKYQDIYEALINNRE